MAFFTFDQNDSGGGFDRDLEKGITNFVIIEAIDEKDANEKAERIGLYFGGVEKSLDCICCGDRWRPAYYMGADSEPTVQMWTIEELRKTGSPYGRGSVCVHYDDGRREWL